MKRMILTALAVILTLGAMAQSQYLSADRYTKGDRAAQLDGLAGILILSQHSDLVITVRNASGAAITPRGMGKSGYYEYEVVVDRQQQANPKIELNRRGNIIKTDFTSSPKANYFVAYLLSEPEVPVEIIDQSTANNSTLSREWTELEINSTFPDLKVEYSDLLQAQVTTRQKENDNSIYITTLRIPVKVFAEVENKMKKLESEFKALDKKLTEDVDASGMSKATDEQWAQLDNLKGEYEMADKDWDEINVIYVHAPKTNTCAIDGLSQKLGPEVRLTYGVRPLKTVEVRHKTKFSGFMEEGGRQYGLRNYEEARQAFVNAMNADDAPADMRASVQTNISQCDTCITYEKYTLGAFGMINKIKKEGGTQEQVVNVASAAVEYLTVLNRYNPNDFYTSRAEALEKMIKNLPLEVQFTTVRWVNNASGFFEAGKIQGVEIWVVKGTSAPAPNDYRTDKKFKELLNRSNVYEHVATTNADGQADVQMNRTDLPLGFLLRPTGSNADKIKIHYLPFNDIMKQSQGTYNKRRFRVKMYAAY